MRKGLGKRRQIKMSTRGSFSSELEYLIHLERARTYIDQQFRDAAKRFTHNLRRSKYTGALK